MAVKLIMHERVPARAFQNPTRGFFDVEITVVPGEQRVVEKDFKVLSRNCERLKGALNDGEIQVLREDGNDHLLIYSQFQDILVYRAAKYLIPANTEITVSDEEWEELREDSRFEACLQDGTIEFLGRE